MIKSIVVNPTRLKVKGGLKAQKEFRASCADELREFLQENKYKYISTDNVRNFYSQRFPDLNIKIKNERHRFPLMGLAEQNYNAKTLDMSDCEVSVASSSPLDKLMGLFGYKPHKDEFFIDDKFTEVFIHETTHMWQHFMNPYYTAYLKGVNKLVDGNRADLKEIINRRDCVYSSLVYNDSVLPLSPKMFKKNFRSALRDASFDNDSLALSNLKTMIRDLENEQEAYVLGKKQLKYYRNPDMMNNKEYMDYVDRESNADADGRFDFNYKLKIMKNEYFSLVKKLRRQNSSD